jgi:predicted phage tail protein
MLDSKFKNFDEIFSLIVKTEEENSERLDKLKLDKKNEIEKFKESKKNEINIEKNLYKEKLKVVYDEKINLINIEIENRKEEILKSLADSKIIFEFNKSKAIDFLNIQIDN